MGRMWPIARCRCALGDDGQIQPVRHIHHRLHDLHALAAVLLIHVDELHVQLDGIDVGNP